MPTAEIISQGDEIVTGQVVDTNAAWLAQQLTALGFDVVSQRAAGDNLPRLQRLFSSSVADITICTGGLGPTVDDLTAQAVSDAFQLPLELDEPSLSAIAQRYARLGRPMPAANRKQAMLPQGATVLTNDWGTAPGFHVEEAGRHLFCLPGVPREMKAMFAARVEPALSPLFALAPQRLHTLHTTGIGESGLEDLLGSLPLPQGISLSYRTMPGQNLVKVVGSSHTSPQDHADAIALVRETLGHYCFGQSAPSEVPPSLPSHIGELLAARGETLSVAESCTGGLISSLCTRVPGASAWFNEAMITYTNAAKIRQLGVSSRCIAEHGAVSEQVVRQMAEGARTHSGSTYALATSGIAGPSGGSIEKPVGTVHIALATPSATLHKRLMLPGDRFTIQRRAAHGVLNLLRLHLTR